MSTIPKIKSKMDSQELTLQDISSLRVRSFARKPSKLSLSSRYKVVGFHMQGVSIVWNWLGKGMLAESTTYVLPLSTVKSMRWLNNRSEVKVSLRNGDVLIWYV